MSAIAPPSPLTTPLPPHDLPLTPSPHTMPPALITCLQEASRVLTHGRIRLNPLANLTHIPSSMEPQPASLMRTLVVLSQMRSNVIEIRRPQRQSRNTARPGSPCVLARLAVRGLDALEVGD